MGGGGGGEAERGGRREAYHVLWLLGEENHRPRAVALDVLLDEPHIVGTLVLRAERWLLSPETRGCWRGWFMRCLASDLSLVMVGGGGKLVREAG